jgi:hypothetical protein
MSDQRTTELIERAGYVREQYLGTYLPEAIDNLIAENDLEKLEFLIKDAEAELSRNEFYNNDIIGESDEY